MDVAARALELVSIPSVTGDEQHIADYVEAWALKLFGSEAVVRTGNSLAVGPQACERPPLLLVGHLDTVPPGTFAHRPRIEGDRLYGLGASDMKGGLAVMMALAEEKPASPVRYIFYEREEGPYEESGLGPLMDCAPDFKRAALAIALEPTDGAVQLGCVGSLHATVTFRGAAAHSARPWQGKNAIHAAGAFLAELEALRPKEVSVGGLSFFEVLSATRAEGGTARNVVPDRFELNLNYRFAPGRSAQEAFADLQRFVGNRAEVTLVDDAPSARVCAGNAHVERLIAATGRKAEAKQAWTDVARLSAWGLDAVNYGPGQVGQAHQPNESASVAALTETLTVLRMLCKTYT